MVNVIILIVVDVSYQRSFRQLLDAEASTRLSTK